MWEQRAREAGWPADWRLSDEVIEASRLAVLGDHKAGCDLWIYCYGSLMWDPGFHFAEVRLADIEGYQRRFTLKINLGRGSRDYPALMLSLEPQQGCCRGLAFRIAADSVHAETAILWRREMLRGGYAPAVVPMLTPQGPIEALAFVSNPSHPSYVGELPFAETASMIASGKGILGTNREYLVQLAMQLGALGIRGSLCRAVACADSCRPERLTCLVLTELSIPNVSSKVSRKILPTGPQRRLLC